jgi:hypothetical protein
MERTFSLMKIFVYFAPLLVIIHLYLNVTVVTFLTVYAEI